MGFGAGPLSGALRWGGGNPLVGGWPRSQAQPPPHPDPIFSFRVSSFRDGPCASWDHSLARLAGLHLGDPVVRTVLTEVRALPPGSAGGMASRRVPRLRRIARLRPKAKACASVSPRAFQDPALAGGPSSCAGLHPLSVKRSVSCWVTPLLRAEKGDGADGRVFLCEHR